MPSTTRNPRQPRIDATRTTPTRHNPVVGITLLLQLRSATQGVTIRTRDPDSGDAGWACRGPTHAQRRFRVHAAILINNDRRDDVCRTVQTAVRISPGTASGGLNNSRWRKHHVIVNWASEFEQRVPR